MDIETFRRGAFIGFAVAAPVGPIGILVIQRSLRGARLGLVTGLGAAAADTLYAIAGAFATALVARVLAHAWLLELAGGVALSWLAIRTWLAPAADPRDDRAAPTGYARAFLETLGLTLANPATILSFAAVSAGVGLGADPSARGVALLCLGVLAGSAAWWLLLSGGVRLVSRQLGPRALRAIRVGSSAVLAAFAAFALYRAAADSAWGERLGMHDGAALHHETRNGAPDRRHAPLLAARVERET